MFEADKHKVAIVDYGLGNLFSVQYACRAVGLECIITHDRELIQRSAGIILPGVGAFGDAMANLKKLDLVGVLKDCVHMHKPFFGICLGMQLLLSQSEEFGIHPGLDIIRGKVIRFDQGRDQRAVKIPQVGWNRIRINPGHPGAKEGLLKGIHDEEFMYFVHSYYAVPEDENLVLTKTSYEGIAYCSSFLKDSVLAVQFHPEKSGSEGLKFYQNWAHLVHAGKELVNP